MGLVNSLVDSCGSGREHLAVTQGCVCGGNVMEGHRNCLPLVVWKQKKECKVLCMAPRSWTKECFPVSNEY